jgi:predicted PurR-regulated permease PerM
VAFPSPNKTQAEILWTAITAFAVFVLLGLIGGVAWGVAWIVNVLSPVLLPLTVAGIIAYLLDPVVDFIEKKGIPRTRAIIMVFFLSVSALFLFLSTAGPSLAVQAHSGYLYIHTELENIEPSDFIKKSFRDATVAGALVEGGGINMTNQAVSVSTQTTNVVNPDEEEASSLFGSGEALLKSFELPTEKIRGLLLSWGGRTLPMVGRWLVHQISAILSWAGLMVGLSLVPVYVFYFLLEKKGISANWEAFLPMRESSEKREMAFVLRAINEHLIVFFRGQVLVAMCVGGLLTIGFFIVGLEYALLLGVVAGALSIVPYLGIMMSILPAITIALLQPDGGLVTAVLVGVVFVVVQMAEGLVISPRIIGDRVGLHPLTIIVAVMIGTTLMGGIIGGILAIPLTASLKVLMFRYVWIGKRHYKSAPIEAPSD